MTIIAGVKVEKRDRRKNFDAFLKRSQEIV
jgi:hypothetical protein